MYTLYFISRICFEPRLHVKMKHTPCTRNRGTLVGTVTRLLCGLSGVRIPVMARDFSLLRNVRPFLGPPYSVVLGGYRCVKLNTDRGYERLEFYTRSPASFNVGRDRDWIGRPGDRIPVGGEIFHTSYDRSWGPRSPLYSGYRVCLLGAKRPDHGVDHPSLAPRLQKE